jgi:signal transduction histidine kinase
MLGASNRIGLAGALSLCLLLTWGLPERSAAESPSSFPTIASEESTITNLAQLCLALSSEERLYRDLRLEAVVCASGLPGTGVLVVQDATGVELLELGRRAEALAPGQRIRLEGRGLLLRRRELGTQLSAAPVVDNDRLHGWRTVAGEVVLKKGRVPLELDWFNCLKNFNLGVLCQSPKGQAQALSAAALWHARAEAGSVQTNLLPGLQVEAYEGYWEQVPDFDLLRAVQSGSATNFDLALRPRDELVGLRYTGFWDVPQDGRYTFQLSSDDGSQLFLGRPELSVNRLGASQVPAAQPGLIGQPMSGLEERRWLSVKGRVSFIARAGVGLELELRSGTDTLSVKVMDASGLEPAAWLNRYVRAVGVGRAALSASQRLVLDRLLVPDARGLSAVELDAEAPGPSLPLASIGQVQSLGLGEAQRALPVRIRGVITAANRGDRWFSLQDDTRGIFVNHHSVSNTFPGSAELWEVLGHTAPGNFAPVVIADRIERLGQGRMPEPARPSWNDLANGSMDVQWVEFLGLVSGVQSNRLTLLLPEGPLEVKLENYFEPELKPYLQAVVRVRGTLFAVWNADTREVQFGSLLMRHASVSVETPPPADPFNAPLKSARDLLRFDAQANAFRPVKVRAQVLYTDAQGLFATEAGMGLRVLTTEAATLLPGDSIEAVGYPEIGGPSPLLRQAVVRKTGAELLPKPRVLAGPELLQKGLDSTLVCVEGKLIGLHAQQNSPVLELQSDGRLFVARVKPGPAAPLSLRLGSTIQLTGIYAETGHYQPLRGQVAAFELLLNSPADIRVLVQPSWWTLERLGAVVGLLVVGLVLAAVWITQLRRQVEQRSAQLQREIRERERAEHHQELEAERARIARDLHDDLGSSLTEIGVLASTGQRALAEPGGAPALFDAIAGKARGSIAALDVIVWAVDPEDNSLQSLADYLSGFAGEYLSHFRVVCRFKIPMVLPAIMLEGRLRHDLFLAVKETLNNVVRHAHSSEVEFGMAVTPDGLEIVVADNGKGFDMAVAGDGNGLKNLQSRLGKLGGSCAIESRVGRGTTITIGLPLPETARDGAA